MNAAVGLALTSKRMSIYSFVLRGGRRSCWITLISQFKRCFYPPHYYKYKKIWRCFSRWDKSVFFLCYDRMQRSLNDCMAAGFGLDYMSVKIEEQQKKIICEENGKSDKYK